MNRKRAMQTSCVRLARPRVDYVKVPFLVLSCMLRIIRLKVFYTFHKSETYASILVYLLASKVIFIPCLLFSASHSSSKTSNYSWSVILIY